ncbi:LacI family DNA-binding transcriptional regulator [Paenibacillus nasutitermitis]|uniref:LacI family transcriptional regulator n=1 Tax=Paenibacillus nasutitermitis TaxID=1652958 RepID=A0A917DVZ0_9BACL|nr:LacI family DNA-binding transcriptional regulator [Paenibacillus nasutitermitis]GGD72081.1 LacI family transcriptional regulator [Paenibacillus nasutitermitis]
MSKKITLDDISKQLGLSTAAVSKALRGLDGISEETRKLVIDTAKRLKYKSFAELPAETKNVTGKVMFLVDHRVITEPHTMASYFYMDKAFKEYGMQVTLQVLPSNDDELLVEPLLRDPDIIAHFMFGRTSAHIAELLGKANKPLIIIDHFFPYSNIDSVMVDDYYGAFLAVKHFVNNGHVRIGFIGDNKLSPGFHARYRGFCDALDYWGLDLHPEFMYDIRFVNAYGDIRFNILQEKLDFKHLPTAFFCANDPIAFVLNNALIAEGIQIPDEVSIIGFDNLDSCQWQSPPLTSLNYPREQIAVQTLNLLLWRMENPGEPCNKILIQPDLVKRQSVSIAKK